MKGGGKAVEGQGKAVVEAAAKAATKAEAAPAVNHNPPAAVATRSGGSEMQARFEKYDTDGNG